MIDEHIVKGCIDGSAVHQRLLYDRFQAKMLGLCMRYANDRDEAQDILQDGFIQVFKKINAFKGSGSLEGWIRKIMVNTALQHIRKIKKHQGNVSIEQLEMDIDAGHYILESINAADILKFIKELPDGYRTVFNLYAIEGYSHKEIAKELGISINTSFSQFSRAKNLLQKMLEHHKVI